MNRLVPVLLCALGLVIVPKLRGATVMGPITNEVTGHLYYLLDADYWTNAEAEAVQLGGHLVTINDADENAWVLTTFGYFGGTAISLFIGFTDQGHEGTWTWLTGETVTYKNWNVGEPNNGAGVFPYENYAMMYGPYSARPGTWNDIIGSEANQQFYGVVEVAPLVTVPVSIRLSDVELCWPSISNISYQVQYQSDLTGGVWSNLFAPIIASDTNTCTRIPIVPGDPQKFYRIVVP